MYFSTSQSTSLLGSRQKGSLNMRTGTRNMSLLEPSACAVLEPSKFHSGTSVRQKGHGGGFGKDLSHMDRAKCWWLRSGMEHPEGINCHRMTATKVFLHICRAQRCSLSTSVFTPPKHQGTGGISPSHFTSLCQTPSRCQHVSVPVCQVEKGEDLILPFPPSANNRDNVLSKPQRCRADIYPAAWYNPRRQLQQLPPAPHKQGEQVLTPTVQSTPELFPGDAQGHPPSRAVLPSMLLGSLSRVLLLQRTPSPLPSIQT